MFIAHSLGGIVVKDVCASCFYLPALFHGFGSNWFEGSSQV